MSIHIIYMRSVGRAGGRSVGRGLRTSFLSGACLETGALRNFFLRGFFLARHLANKNITVWADGYIFDI